MLTIQKFADLAGTTKRTLNFYDEKGLFKPKKTAANGYRFYDYDQLYEITFILELRRLGLSMTEIKQLNQDAGHATLNSDLQEILQKINEQLDNLTILRETLYTRFNQSTNDDDIVKNRPFIADNPAQLFCRSRQSVACTEQEIAEIYHDFYEQLGKIKLVDRRDSGFLTELPNSDANRYPTASFCILKAVAARTNTGDLPLIQKPAGKYLTIDTSNDTKNICISLQILVDYIAQQQLTIDDQLWQMNLGEAFTSKGSSALVRLQYRLQ